MPTYNFNLNRDEVIKGALRILGVISQGETPDSAQISDGAEALNVLIKAYESEGMPVWAIKTQQITPVAGDGVYDIGTTMTVNVAKPERIYQAFYTTTATNISINMSRLSQDQYWSLSNRSQEGTPTQYYWDDKNTSGNLYLYLVPDATFAAANTITIVYQAPFADFDSNTDVPDFPQYWLRALKYGLADEISMEYGYPIKDRQELMLRAEKYKDEALSFVQEEASYFFQPNNYRR
jgi:hypothetical protein